MKVKGRATKQGRDQRIAGGSPLRIRRKAGEGVLRIAC